MDSWIIDTIESMGYWGIVLLMFLENVFPPIPSELIMPVAGYIASQGNLAFTGVVMAGTAGSVLGALPLYYIGYKVGESRLQYFVSRYGHWFTVSQEEMDKSKEWFERHGGSTVLFCRLIPAIRSLISIPAGLACMSIGRFLFYTTIGSALWTAFLAYSGFLLGNQFSEVAKYIDPVSKLIIAALIVIYIVRVIQQRKSRQAKESS
jgi:membrane protein DedA with SNARE-associated domain